MKKAAVSVLGVRCFFCPCALVTHFLLQQGISCHLPLFLNLLCTVELCTWVHGIVSCCSTLLCGSCGLGSSKAVAVLHDPKQHFVAFPQKQPVLCTSWVKSYSSTHLTRVTVSAAESEEVMVILPYALEPLWIQVSTGLSSQGHKHLI